IDALKLVLVDAPLVVRLEGTNAKEAAELLENSGMDFLVATSLEDAAKKVTAAIKE
ncbi:MAG TPA: succinate--CoA ligase subunit beta, partial [Candidatus Marinimicrobia bacterium]|nr:succinate--CoA ligase subunit beta [Candidatus Neomarinimicrobiota bacterium]